MYALVHCTLELSFEGCFLVFHLNQTVLCFRSKMGVGGEKDNFKCNFPLSSCVWTSAFAKQSASFALATTHSLDVLLNAAHTGVHSNRVWVSRPYCHSVNVK